MRGFTLIELLVALVLAVLLASMAVPSVSAWVAHQRARADILAMTSLLQTARHAAINLGASVMVCPRRADQGAERCGARNTWHLGTLAFVDRNLNRTVDEQDYLVASLPQLQQGRFYWRAFRNRSYLRFTAKGVTDWQNGHFLYCSDDGDPKHARQLVLNASGRIYFSYDHDEDGVHEDVSGAPLVCP